MDEQQEIIQSIIDVNNIAIVMHDNPDSDAIGSAIALENALKQMNKQVTIITQNKIKNSNYYEDHLYLISLLMMNFL